VLIDVFLSERTNVTVTIYDSKGNKKDTIYEGEKDAGLYRYSWKVKSEIRNNLGSGIYFVQMQAGKYIGTKKIAVVK